MSKLRLKKVSLDKVGSDFDWLFKELPLFTVCIHFSGIYEPSPCLFPNPHGGFRNSRGEMCVQSCVCVFAFLSQQLWHCGWWVVPAGGGRRCLSVIKHLLLLCVWESYRGYSRRPLWWEYSVHVVCQLLLSVYGKTHRNATFVIFCFPTRCGKVSQVGGAFSLMHST